MIEIPFFCLWIVSNFGYCFFFCFVIIIGVIGNIPIMMAKPQTFMNLSGESVSELIGKQLWFI